MAGHLPSSTLHKDTSCASLALAPSQSIPLSFEQLSPPTGKVPETKVTGRKPDHLLLSTTSVTGDFENADTSSAALVPSDACHVTSIATQVDNLVMRDKYSSSELASTCEMAEGDGREHEDLRNGFDNPPQACAGSLEETTRVLTSVSTSDPVESSTIVLGEEVTGCVVMDLQGNMVVQEHPSVQAATGPYLVDEELLVQVSQEPEPVLTVQTSEPLSNSRMVDQNPTGPKVNENGSLFNKVVRKGSAARSEEVKDESKLSCMKASDGKKGPALVNLKSRWNFREVLVKREPEHQTADVPQSDFVMEGESDTHDHNRPRRKSAREARLRWKSIHDVDSLGNVGAKKSRRAYFLPKDKRSIKIENSLQEAAANEQTIQDLPVWAHRLTSVRLIDRKWIVGVAASRTALEQTLEGHSRSILCDYIKSHPSSLEYRHRTRSQISRLMWHHQQIKFDGKPFTILSSDILKCAFGMNYKIKRKDSEGTTQNKPKRPAENFGNEERVDEETGEEEAGRANRDQNRNAMKENLPKKKYKNITFTSCAARITVKVLVKYPGYAVSSTSLATERKAMLKALRFDMSRGMALEKEELYLVTLPLSLVHNHALQGQSRGIHPSIAYKIKELVSEGVTAPKVIKGILDSHVQAKHSEDMIVPQLDDRAFYPRVKDIANLVYSQCKKMGISAKRKGIPSEPSIFETNQKKKKKHKRIRMDGENDVLCTENVMSNSVPLQASTLQEAVQTFCTDEPDRGSLGGLEGRECIPPDVSQKDGPGELAGLAEMVRGQLDTLRGLTYSVNEVAGLQEMYQSLQVILNQYMIPNSHTLQEGMTEAPANTTAFIIHDPLVEPLASSTSSAQDPPESKSEHLAISDRDGTGSEGAGKSRGNQNVNGQLVRQLRPPVALQCLTTSVVPTLAVSQLPRSTSQNPHHPPTAHIVTSVPLNNNPPSAPATIPQPTYQTLGPATPQDGTPAPVHLSLPPYFYYVQEVTVPESGQNWTYSSSS